MSFSSKQLVLGAAALAAASIAPLAAHATVVTYPDFSNTSGLTFKGSAGTTTTSDGVVLRVTPSAGGQSGAAYSTTPVTLGSNDIFSTVFSFRFTQPGGIDPADGITFVLAASPNGLGTGGGDLGYGGVGSSVAVEFDTFWNGGVDSNSNHVAVDTDGSLNDLALASPYGQSFCDFGGPTTFARAGCFSNGDLWTATIGYDGTNLSVRVNDGAMGFQTLVNTPLDVMSHLGTNQAFVGFTAGTGSGFENHDIVNWSFANTTQLSSGTPEPSAWALMLLGFGGLGAALRRRRSLAIA